MKTPLYNEFLKYIGNNVSRFHMPGHKGQDIYNLGNLWLYDITEVKNFDNLLYSNGVIKQVEDKYTEIYNSYASVISTQGSTLGVQMMVTAAYMIQNGQSNKIIIDRNAHASAVNTIAVLGFEPVWVYPDECNNNYMPGVISANCLEEVILCNQDAEIVYITSPNYFGEMADLKSISDICKKHNKLLLVDNAHGAHLKFIEGDLHPMDCNCDCCCDSLHKSLPVLTGGGMVHTLNPEISKYLKRAARIYSSTSPSYLTMLSIDCLCSYIEGGLKSDLQMLIEKIDEIKKLICDLGFDLPSGKLDPIKISIGPGKFNCTAGQIAEKLREFNVEPEYVGSYWVLLMTSPQNISEDFVNLKDALIDMSKTFHKTVRKSKIDEKAKYLKTQQILPIKEAIFKKFKTIKTVKSLNKISAQIIVTVPPCVPIVMPGEIVSREAIDLLLFHKIYFIDVVDD